MWVHKNGRVDGGGGLVGAQSSPPARRPHNPCPLPCYTLYKGCMPLWASNHSFFHPTLSQHAADNVPGSSAFSGLTGGGRLTAGWQSQLQWWAGQGRHKCRDWNPPPEQNLVCVIIVHRARWGEKIHSTWCIHCFQPKAPQLLYNHSDHNQLTGCSNIQKQHLLQIFAASCGIYNTYKR